MPRRRALAAALLLAPVVAAIAALGDSASTVAGPGAARPAAPAFGTPPEPAECLAVAGGVCATPATLRAAYDLAPLYARGITGQGVTIGIVDSFGSPTLAADLAVYDRQYGLPPVSLTTIAPAGPVPAYTGSTDRAGWAGETTLDVEVAHTIAPGAKILLIVTPTSETEGLTGFPDIVTAERAVLAHRQVDVLSQSFAATEPTFADPAQITALSARVYPQARASGVTVLSSSGDNGPTDDERDLNTLYTRAVTDWPASDPLVTAVGGTTLHLGVDGTVQRPASAWGGQAGGGAGGGGRSEVFSRPGYQDGVAAVVGAHRGVPDIAADAAVASGLITYGSYAGGDGWSIGGGTSQAAPLVAGIVALADQAAGHRVGFLNDALYGTLAKSATSGIVDVTDGSNDLVSSGGTTNVVPGYQAGAGYDLATGLGTLDGARFVPAIDAATKGRQQPLTAAGGAPTTSPVPSPRPASTPATTAGSAAAPAPDSATSGAQAADDGGTPVGAIVGGTVGGILVLAVVVGLVVHLSRRRA